MKIYEIKEEKIKPPVVGVFTLSNGVKIPAITVGEKGRGRQCGVLPVKLRKESLKKWKKDKKVEIHYTRLSETRTHRPKIVETKNSENSDEDHVILVLRSPIGFRGSNEHKFERRVTCLVEGVIAQGEAGRMGSGRQYVVVSPVPNKIKVSISGRRYGKPHGYIYTISREGVSVMTDKEAEILSEDDINELLLGGE
ncbi:MAG: hypothetical protein H5T41_09895 [Methanomassiliicoccales archaeon]|nr:hypothetical protein [Methanomassiliicoccales archaeon]